MNGTTLVALYVFGLIKGMICSGIRATLLFYIMKVDGDCGFGLSIWALHHIPNHMIDCVRNRPASALWFRKIFPWALFSQACSICSFSWHNWFILLTITGSLPSVPKQNSFASAEYFNASDWTHQESCVEWMLVVIVYWGRIDAHF